MLRLSQLVPFFLEKEAEMVMYRKGNLPYRTWNEASLAAQRLGVRSGADYHERLAKDEDPRLPYHPDWYYLNSWEVKGGWEGFLGLK